MDLASFEKIFKNEPKYRFGQAKKAVFQDLIDDWEKASTLPKSLRKKLSKNCPISIDAQLFHSKGSLATKALITLHDSERIEAVLMRHRDKRNTVCASSQVGCKLGCKFCATGSMGFRRDLIWYEMVEQVVLFARILKAIRKKVTNVVFMGMGEPFLNYDNVIEAGKSINDKDGLNLGARKISISTVGITEGIEKLSEEKLQVNLAVSLHAPIDSLRSKLMPINKRYPIKKLLSAVDSYIEKTNRKVMFEYVLLSRVNDDEKHARKLAELLRGKLCMVNLIPCNEVLGFVPPNQERIRTFKKILEQNKINVVQRYSFGQDIDAACGQLAVKSK